MWKPFGNFNYLNTWVFQLRKMGCLSSFKSEKEKCKQQFPNSQIIACDLRQELFFEFQTFIDDWYKNNENQSTDYVDIHSFLYNKAKEENLLKDYEKILFLHWIDCLVTARETRRKIFYEKHKKYEEFMQDLYYDLTHPSIYNLSKLFPFLNKYSKTYYSLKFDSIFIPNVFEMSMTQSLHEKMIRDCLNSWTETPSIYQVVENTSWLLDLYSLINVFASKAKHCILVTGYDHTRLIHFYMESLAIFEIFKSPLFDNSGNQCISFNQPLFDFSQNLFTSVVPKKQKIKNLSFGNSKKRTKRFKKKCVKDANL